MKLFTIFFYLIAILSILIFKEYMGSNPIGLLGNLAFFILPILLIHGPLISLAGFIYAYEKGDAKLMTCYTILVTIPVAIACCTLAWNANN